jgi:hypothetical protein
MKVSVHIDQCIGAESFPSFPASRRFRRTARCVATKVARSRQSAATMFVHLRSARLDGQWLNDHRHPSASHASIQPSHLEPAPSPHGLARDNPPRQCSPTSGATDTPFHILVRDDPPEKLRGRIISGRLGLLIRNIKPKRQHTVTPCQSLLPPRYKVALRKRVTISRILALSL